MKIRIWLFAGLFWFFLTNLLATDGHQMIGIGAIQKSTGGAGVARGEDATWVLLNPAAIRGLERRFDISLELFAPTRSMSPSGPALPMMGGQSIANTAGTAEDDSVFYIPTLGVVLPYESFTFGLGFYGVNGMGVDYEFPRTTLPLFSGQIFDSRSEYSVGKLATALAWNANEDWILGVQTSLSISRFRGNMLTGSFAAPEHQNEWDTSLGGGFQLGVVRSMEWGSFGASYISRQWMESFDKYEDLFKESLDLPPMLQAGMAWDVTQATTLLLDLKWIGWSSIDSIGDSPDEYGFGWEDQYVWKSGLIHQLYEKWTLRLGFSHGRSPIREGEVFANALFPAIVETHATAGVGVRITPGAELHFTYMHAFENSLTQSESGSDISQAGAGTRISLKEDSFGIQLSCRF